MTINGRNRRFISLIIAFLMVFSNAAPALAQALEEPAAVVAEQAPPPAPVIVEEAPAPPAEQPAPAPVEQPAPAPVEQPAPAPVEQPAPAPVEQPVPEAAPAPEEQPTPVEQPVPVEEPAPVEEPTPAEQPTPVEEPAPVEDPTPAGQPTPVEEPTPANQPAAPVEEPTPADQPAAPVVEEPVAEEPTQQEAAFTPEELAFVGKQLTQAEFIALRDAINQRGIVGYFTIEIRYLHEGATLAQPYYAVVKKDSSNFSVDSPAVTHYTLQNAEDASVLVIATGNLQKDVTYLKADEGIPADVGTVTPPDEGTEPLPEEPAAQEPAAQEPTPEEPIAEEPASEEPVPEEPTTEEPIVEEPVPEEPTEDPAEEPVEEPLSLTPEQESLIGTESISMSSFMMMRSLIQENNMDLVTVTINYVDSLGSEVAKPYLAVIEPGIAEYTVTSPGVMGYVLQDKAQATITVATGSNFAATVTYLSTSSTYAVHHHLEQLDGTYLHIASEDQTLTGVEGNLTQARAKTGQPAFTGFVNFPIEQKDITADDTTVVDVKYWRVTYYINFSTGDGGSAVDSIPVKYGTRLETVCLLSKLDVYQHIKVKLGNR